MMRARDLLYLALERGEARGSSCLMATTTNQQRNLDNIEGPRLGVGQQADAESARGSAL